MTQNEYRPLGAHKPAQPVINRRAFLGASVAVPAALAFDGTARMADALGDPYDLRFVEDEQGMSVIFVQNKVEVLARWCAITPQDEVWRLHRLAFGPSTTFTLRTLQAGSKKGYELQIGGLRFGALEGRSHWIVFQRLDVGRDWRVRMRSNLSGPTCKAR